VCSGATRAFSTAHNYLHVFAPAGHEWKHHRNRLPRNDRPGTWRNGDGDPRGHWSTVSLVARGGHGTRTSSTGSRCRRGASSSRRPARAGVTRERFAALRRHGLIWCGPDGDNVPPRKVFRADAQGLVPSTWWTLRAAGHNAEANAEARRLFPGARPFSTPKPERLIALERAGGGRFLVAACPPAS